MLVDVQPFDRLQVRGGQFKIPFSLDQLTGRRRLDFVYRSRLAYDLAPGRDRGVTVHGRFKSRGLRYDAGFFQHDGDNARFGCNRGAGKTIAGRITLRPFQGPAARPTLKRLELAADMTIGNVPKGLNALKGRTTLAARLSEPVYVNGRRLRAGVDAAWAAGPFSLKGEMLRVSDERRGQGLLGEDLPSLLSRGWYISGAWAIQVMTGYLDIRRFMVHVAVENFPGTGNEKGDALSDERRCEKRQSLLQRRVSRPASAKENTLKLRL